MTTVQVPLVEFTQLYGTEMVDGHLYYSVIEDMDFDPKCDVEHLLAEPEVWGLESAHPMTAKEMIISLTGRDDYTQYTREQADLVRAMLRIQKSDDVDPASDA